MSNNKLLFAGSAGCQYWGCSTHANNLPRGEYTDKLLFEGERIFTFDLPLWGRGTIRRMVDEVKIVKVQYIFEFDLTHRKRSPLPKGEGLVSR